jgi:hypothetical protein
MRATVVFVSVACCLPAMAAAQSKLPLGVGAGSYAGAGGPADVAGQVTFKHAIAYRVFEGDDRTKRSTVVLVSDVPVAEPRARDEEHLSAQAKAGRLKALQIRLANADGRVTRHAVFDERGRTELETPEKAAFAKTYFSPTRIEGQVMFYPKAEAVVVQRGYLTIFNALVRQGPWVEPGQANGTIRLGTRSFDARHALVRQEGDAVTVVVSSAPLEGVGERAGLAAKAGAGDVAVVWATLASKDGAVRVARCLGPGVPASDVEATGLDWQKEEWKDGLMRGRLVTESAAGSACAADVYFAAKR